MVLDSNREISSRKDLLCAADIDFETLVKLSNEAVLLLSLTGTPVFISPAAERLFGWNAEKFAEQLSDFVHVGVSSSDAELLHRILSGKGDPTAPLPKAELLFRTAFGPLVWMEVTTHLLRDTEGKPSAFAIYLRSIARRKELESLLEAATQTDPLTGLFNRRAFDDMLNREWAIALREKTHISLIKISLDRFEALTRNGGPAAADDCLVRIAATLKDIARRPADTAARTAASEFSLLLPRTHDMGAETISAYIHLAIQDLGIPIAVTSPGDGVLSVSVGAASAVAEQTGITERSEFLLSAAEDCLFQARQEGGNRVKTVMKVLTR